MQPNTLNDIERKHELIIVLKKSDIERKKLVPFLKEFKKNQNLMTPEIKNFGSGKLD